MNIAWVISESSITQKSLPTAETLKSIAPSWGGWKTWKQFRTDNSISLWRYETVELMRNAFHAVSHLYIPLEDFKFLGEPAGMSAFNGSFSDTDVPFKSDIVALNLAAQQADVVLLVGFNLGDNSSVDPALWKRYVTDIEHVFKHHANTQFVLIGYPYSAPVFDNVTVDTIDSVKSLLA